MTAAPQRLLKYLLVKRGLYYRPDNSGYTGIKERAGRYERSQADRRSGVRAIREDRAPMFSPACFDDMKVEHLSELLAASQADVNRLRRAIIEMGHQIPGVVLHASVSTDFLMLLPQEMKDWQKRVSSKGENGA